MYAAILYYVLLSIELQVASFTCKLYYGDGTKSSTGLRYTRVRIGIRTLQK